MWCVRVCVCECMRVCVCVVCVCVCECMRVYVNCFEIIQFGLKLWAFINSVTKFPHLT